jgi:hypothetical protein
VNLGDINRWDKKNLSVSCSSKFSLYLLLLLHILFPHPFKVGPIFCLLKKLMSLHIHDWDLSLTHTNNGLYPEGTALPSPLSLFSMEMGELNSHIGHFPSPTNQPHDTHNPDFSRHADIPRHPDLSRHVDLPPAQQRTRTRIIGLNTAMLGTVTHSANLSYAPLGASDWPTDLGSTGLTFGSEGECRRLAGELSGEGQSRKRHKSVLLSYECHPIHQAMLVDPAFDTTDGNQARSCRSAKPTLPRLVVPPSGTHHVSVPDNTNSSRVRNHARSHPYSAYPSTTHSPYPVNPNRSHLTNGRPRSRSLNLNSTPAHGVTDVQFRDSPTSLRERRQVRLQIDFPNSAMARFRVKRQQAETGSTSASESSSLSTPVSGVHSSSLSPPEASGLGLGSMGTGLGGNESMKMGLPTVQKTRLQSYTAGMCPPPVVAVAMEEDEADHLFSGTFFRL